MTHWPWLPPRPESSTTGPLCSTAQRQTNDRLHACRGAIEFVHIRTPLTGAAGRAPPAGRRGKEDVGRNAIAVRVRKPRGLALQWAMPWEQALDETTRCASAPWRSSLRAGNHAEDAGAADASTGFQQVLLSACKACCSVLPAPTTTLKPCCWPNTCILGAAGQAHRHGARGTRRPVSPAGAMPPMAAPGRGEAAGPKSTPSRRRAVGALSGPKGPGREALSPPPV